MNNIYEPPKSDLVKCKGIDGKTCPICKNKFGLMAMMFKAYIPNSYTCPSCKAKLRHDFHPLFTTGVFILFISICLGTLFFLDEVLGLSRQERLKMYTMIVFIPGCIGAFGIMLYARAKKVLVEK